MYVPGLMELLYVFGAKMWYKVSRTWKLQMYLCTDQPLYPHHPSQ